MWKRSSLYFVAAALILFFGERVTDGLLRELLGGMSGVLYVAALGTALWRKREAQGTRKAAHARVLSGYLLSGLGVGLYLGNTLGVVELSDTLRAVLLVLWPILFFMGAIPALVSARALALAAHAPVFEAWRLRRATRSARIIMLTFISFGAMNYALSKNNIKIDLSYLKTTKVGSANKALVAELSEPLTVFLFFAQGNEVLEHSRGYFEELAEAGGVSRVDIRVVDQALVPDLAKAMQVRGNGVVALRVGAQGNVKPRHQTIRLGLELDAASSRLSRLDSEVHKSLLKLMRPVRLAYFTTGHLERDFFPPADDKRLGLADLRKIMEALGFRTKRLGLADGLGAHVPDDADVVVVAGPIDAFADAEIQTLLRYYRSGGSLWLLCDPDHGTALSPLLQALGLKLEAGLVATTNRRYLWRANNSQISPFNVVSDKPTMHSSNRLFTSGGTRRALALAGAGALTQVDRPDGGLRTTFTFKTGADFWVDLNSNGVFDSNTEKLSSQNVVAAVELQDAVKAEPASEGAPHVSTAPDSATTVATTTSKKVNSKSNESKKPARAMVVADADVVGNVITGFAGNTVFVIDSLRWLLADDKLGGEIQSEKDVRVTRSQDQESWWFYGTSLVLPGCILFLGLFFTQRTRKRGRA